MLIEQAERSHYINTSGHEAVCPANMTCKAAGHDSEHVDLHRANPRGSGQSLQAIISVANVLPIAEFHTRRQAC